MRPLIPLALSLLLAAPALAKVSAEEAAKLGQSLTPVGAEKAANADGTIGAWTNGAMFDDTQKNLTPARLEELRTAFEEIRAANPAPFDKLLGYVDNFSVEKYDEISNQVGAIIETLPAELKALAKQQRKQSGGAERPKFIITAANLAQHADKLTDGHKALFAKYPGYKIFKIKIGEGRQQIEEEYVVDWDANQRVVVGGCYKTPWYAGRLTTRRATDRIQATDAMGFRCAASTAPGVDVASAVIRDLPLGVVPEGVLYDASRAVALDRWTTEPGTAGVEGYSVITGYHYFMFIPVEEAPASGLKRLVEVSHEDGPVHLGLLATTKPLLEPALEPGAYLVAWRGEGKAKELKPAEDEEGEEGEGEGEATDVVVEEAEDEIWDETVDSLIFYDTNGVAVLSVPARDLKYERLKKGEAFPRRVMPTEKEREAGQEPYQEIRFTVPVPGKQSSRGFMFDLRVQVDDGTVDDGWRKP